MKQSYQRISFTERCQISAYLKTKISIQEIARQLRVHRSTIYREIRRNQADCGSYSPKLAEFKSFQRAKTPRKPKTLSCPNLFKTVETHLKKDLSPEQIAGRFGQVSHQTIYNALRNDYPHLRSYLRRYGKRRGRGRKGRRKPRERPSWHLPIQLRPSEVDTRKEVGHWERDTMYVDDRKMLLVCLERKSRYVKLEKLNRIQPLETYRQSIKMMQSTGKEIKTITNDNGAEFMGETMTKFPIFFCSPYAPQERGSVENTIGLLRQYLKRNSKIESFSQKDLRKIEDKLNHRPRKCLNFKTPHEVMFEAVSH